jgi:hypothetical protein
MAFNGLRVEGGQNDRASDSAVPTKKTRDKKVTNHKVTSPKLVPLNKSGTVLLDRKGKRILVKGKVCLTEGPLEMLLCLKQTKEHESILSLNAKAFVIHTGLLALGAKTGTAALFYPKFKAPTGQTIEIFVQWKDQHGRLHRVPAQSWVRESINRFYTVKMKTLPKGVKLVEDDELRFAKKFAELTWYGHMTKKQRDGYLAMTDDKAFRAAIAKFHKRSQPRQMSAGWPFVGSGFFVDKKSGERYYQAESGEVVCVANFSTAMIDVAIPSSASGEGLLFEAYTERIPPRGTEVTVELIPVFKKKTDPRKPRVTKEGPSKKN